jgi:hypothetical protein
MSDTRPEESKVSNEQELTDAINRLSRLVEKQNQALEELTAVQGSFRKRLVAGLWTGFGTVLGATVMVSVLVIVLKPLANVQWISPIVHRVIEDLETRKPTTKLPATNR